MVHPTLYCFVTIITCMTVNIYGMMHKNFANRLRTALLAEFSKVFVQRTIVAAGGKMEYSTTASASTVYKMIGKIKLVSRTGKTNIIIIIINSE